MSLQSKAHIAAIRIFLIRGAVVAVFMRSALFYTVSTSGYISQRTFYHNIFINHTGIVELCRASISFHLVKKWLTLFAPAYLSISEGQRGAYLPSHVIRVEFGLGFQIFLEITCCGMIYHIQKDSWRLNA